MLYIYNYDYIYTHLIYTMLILSTIKKHILSTIDFPKVSMLQHPSKDLLGAADSRLHHVYKRFLLCGLALDHQRCFQHPCR